MNTDQCKPRNERHHHGWLVTFGDLLTLLLSFSVLVAMAAPDKPSLVSASASIAPQDHEPFSNLKVGPGDVEHGGTGIAKVGHQYPSVSVQLTEESFQNRGIELVQVAQDRLKTALIPEGYQTKRVLLSVCQQEQFGRDSSSWHVATGRAIAITSQLVDAGYGGIEMVTEIRGPHCDTSKSVGVIWELGQISNG